MKFCVIRMDENDIKHAFGRAVCKFRHAMGVTQGQLAELSDLHWTYISDIERGVRNVSLVNIVRLAHGLGISPSELLEPLKGAHLSGRKEIK